MGAMRSGTAIGLIVLLFAVNIIFDSVIYLFSVAIDGLTLGGAVYLGWKLIQGYRLRLAAKDQEIASLQEQIRNIPAVTRRSSLKV